MEKILFIAVLLIWLLVPVLAVAVILTISKQVKSRKNLFDNQEFTEHFMLFVASLMLLISVLFILYFLHSVLFDETLMFLQGIK
jgi:hypothetical protein